MVFMQLALSHHTQRFDNCVLALQLSSNNLTHRAVEVIAKLMKYYPQVVLDLQMNFHFPSSSRYTVLNLLIEGLFHTSLLPLYINERHFTSRHAYHLLLIIWQAKNFLALNISRNKFRESVPMLVSATKYVRQLDIYIYYTGIRDEELKKLLRL